MPSQLSLEWLSCDSSTLANVIWLHISAPMNQRLLNRLFKECNISGQN